MKTKAQVNSDYRSSHKPIAVSNEVIELMEKVQSIGNYTETYSDISVSA